MMKKCLMAAGLGVLALSLAGPASARVDVGVSIGIPGVIVAPAPVYVAPPPPVYVAPGYVMPRPYYGAPPVYGRPVVVMPPPPHYYGGRGKAPYYREGHHHGRGHCRGHGRRD